MRITARPITELDVWNFLVSEATLEGSIGKLIADYVDAKISEVVKQVCLTTHPTDSIGKLLKDNLDEKVSNVKTVIDSIKSTVDLNLDEKISNVKADTGSIKTTVDTNLDAKVSEAKGFRVEEMADQKLAAGASLTSTVDGIFTAVTTDTIADEVVVDLYIDDVGAWRQIADCVGLPASNNAKGIVGQANRIRIRNKSSEVHSVVINRAY